MFPEKIDLSIYRLLFKNTAFFNLEQWHEGNTMIPEKPFLKSFMSSSDVPKWIVTGRPYSIMKTDLATAHMITDRHGYRYRLDARYIVVSLRL